MARKLEPPPLTAKVSQEKQKNSGFRSYDHNV